MTSKYVVHYDEIALKGNNRADFVKALRKGSLGAGAPGRIF